MESQQLVQNNPSQRKKSAKYKRTVRKYNNVKSRGNETITKNLLSKKVVFSVIVSSVLVLISGAFSIHSQTRFNQKLSEMNHYENELNALIDENDAYENRIDTSVDLSKIKEEATGRLGMTYPKKDQVETYQIKGNDYIRQFQELPVKK